MSLSNRKSETHSLSLSHTHTHTHTHVPFGNTQVEITDAMDESAWTSGRCFLSATSGGAGPAIEAMRVRASLIPKGPVGHLALKSGGARGGSATVTTVSKPKVAMFNPNDPGAVVLSLPERDGGSVAVVVDPYLGTHLRPHQIEGVTFLYRSVMGHNAREAGIEAGSHGAILADEVSQTRSSTVKNQTTVEQLKRPGRFLAHFPHICLSFHINAMTI